MRLASIVVVVLCACASGNKPASAPPPTGTPVASGTPPATGCETVRGKVAELYRAEAQAHEPTRVAEATADNTAMVMTDCQKAPEPTVACIGRVATVAELEKQCLAPLDPEGTEGEASR
jgi:hypothetical protein